jgi:hypothetical protein
MCETRDGFARNGKYVPSCGRKLLREKESERERERERETGSLGWVGTKISKCK